MKIRIVIVPPEKVSESRQVENAPNAPRLQLQPNSMNEEISLRALIRKCQPISTQMTSWNELDLLQCTAWLCMKDGTGAMEWMWNGKNGIHDFTDYDYHDIEIVFEEVGEIPTNGMCIMCTNVSRGTSLETVLVPDGRILPFFEQDKIASGETKVSYKIYGRVPNEWEGDDPAHPENTLYVSITAVSWFNKRTFEVPPVAESRKDNDVFIQMLMDDQTDESV